jgi:pimeloyl-ACP methyl ester carboxylesterase
MPADTHAVHFEVAGALRVGVYYTAGDGPAPLALMLHGFPGSEKNHDLAQALRALGWHVLVLHFGGAWGSGGLYDLTQHPQDAQAALDFALSDRAPAPVDVRSIAVIGYSMGGRAALIAAHADERIGAVVSMGGFSDFSDTLLESSFFAPSLPFLHGATVEGLTAQFGVLARTLQPYEAAAAIAPRPVWVVHGTADEVVPYYHAPALAAGGSHIQLLPIEGANHTFASHRAPLIEAVCGALQAWRAR